MDRRGLTTDPNASGIGTKKWWETLGPTQKPSPYATASWRYYQDFTVDIIEVPAVPAVVYDNGTDFTKPLYATVWDGGYFNPAVPPQVILDGGGFNGDGNIVIFTKKTFATVYVYDAAASFPDVRGLNAVILNEGDLSTDPELDSKFITTEDGFSFFSERPCQVADDTPPGTLLGQLDYTLTDTRVDVVSWSHYNWQDAAPVKQAFRAMTRSLPQCVDGIYVKDSPTAFWTDLGFRTQAKGDTELKFLPVTYRGY